MPMSENYTLSKVEIDAIGVRIMQEQLEQDGWKITEINPDCDSERFPQLIAEKNGELAFFLVRTGILPERGRFEGGAESYEKIVRYAKSHGADCYFAALGIEKVETATSEQTLAENAVKASFNVRFDGLIRMELPSAD